MKFFIGTVDGREFETDEFSFEDQLEEGESVEEELKEFMGLALDKRRTFISFKIDGIDIFFNPDNITYITTS